MNINVKDARWPGCSAEKQGWFIPCRGGGTATTYYTDAHDVDEDVRAMTRRGGRWTDGKSTGITHQDIVYSTTSIATTIASRLIYLS